MEDNERLARALGLNVVEGWALSIDGGDTYTYRGGERHPHGARPAMLIVDAPDDDPRPIPDYTGSLDACAEAEAEIARRGLGDAYARALCYIVGIPIAEHENWYDPSVDVEHDLFLLITAPPEARVRAMLRALEG